MEGASSAHHFGEHIAQSGQKEPTQYDIMITGLEDGMVTPGASEEPYKSAGLTALMSTSTESITDIHTKDLPATESKDYAQDKIQSTTTPNMASVHSIEKLGGETQAAVEKDGLMALTLVGITVSY